MPARRYARSSVALVAALAGLLACGRATDPHPEATRHACARCHMPEYSAARRPVHAGVRPTACAVCHTSDAWRPSVLDHRWPLTGAHAHTDCFACHAGSPPTFEGTRAACVACHRADFDRSPFPGHAAFPTTCEGCHTTTAWSPATWYPAAARALADAGAAPAATHRPGGARSRSPLPEPIASSATGPKPPRAAPSTAPTHPEDRFPIQSGHHAGIGCARCHDQGGAMGRDDTDCVQCHARARFDGIHSDVGGYPQGAAAPNFCVGCHRHGTRSRF